MKVVKLNVGNLQNETIVEEDWITISSQGVNLQITENENGGIHILVTSKRGIGDGVIIGLSSSNVFDLDTTGNIKYFNDYKLSL